MSTDSGRVVTGRREDQIRADLAREVLEILEPTPCAFWACPGPDVEPVYMATCRPCWATHYLRQVADLT